MATMIQVKCPGCGHEQEITAKEWNETFRKAQVWDGKKKEYRETPGPDAPMRCIHCEETVPAREWHRKAERDYFKSKGWKTEAMERLGW